MAVGDWPVGDLAVVRNFLLSDGQIGELLYQLVVFLISTFLTDFSRAFGIGLWHWVESKSFFFGDNVVRWVQSRQLKHYRRKSTVVLLYCLDYLQRMSTGFLRLACLCFSEFHYVSERYAFLFWLARMLVTVSICTSRHCLMLHSGRCQALVNHFFVCLIISNNCFPWFMP